METNAQYFDCLCRTCMNKVEASSQDGITNPQHQWLSIFDIFDECESLRIAELLSDAVPQIVVQPSDELPKKICTECLQRLLNAYRFQQMCLQSDKIMHELLSKKGTALKTPVLEEIIKGETETNDVDSQSLKELRCSSTLQEPLAELTVQSIEPEAAQSSAADHLPDNTQLLDHCNDTQGEFEEFIKNEPIEDDKEANSEYSDSNTMHSTIFVTKDEVLPIEFEDQQVNDDPSRHYCHLCNKSYKRREYLTRHLNDHKKKANNSKVYCYACHLCRESYKKQQYLTRHLNIAHSMEPQRYDCDVCNKSFASSSGLRQHISIHTGERPNVSPECGKSVSIPAEQRTLHAEYKPYECPYCPLRFSSRPHMASHKTTHEEIKPHKCCICGKKFRRKPDLMRHKRIHSNEKPHKCDQCEMRFITMQDLKMHIRKHTGEKPYKCKYCEREFAASYTLRCHLRRHLGKNIHRCMFCPLAFPSSAEMHLHITSHKNEDPEVRERNLKALQEEEAKLELKFSKERAERQSIEVPAGQHNTYAEDEPFECPYCPLRFSSKRNALTHKAIHEGIKPHKCDICGNKFRLTHDLTKHKRIHSTEKPHKCDLCGRRFSQKQQLKVHIRTHTGEKPYKCKYCEHAFPAFSTLRYHLRSHLGKNSHRCKLCPLAFPSNAEMRLHFTSHKNEDPEVRERNLKALQAEEAKIKLKFSKEISKAPSTEEQQQEKLCNKDIEQPSRE